MAKTNRQHIYFLLDRSGSMSSMASDVIGGFNRFLAEQAAATPENRMTLVQFDTEEPFEVLAEAEKVEKLRPLSSATFSPRGGTPLYDALGRLIVEATIRAERREAEEKKPEEILCVIFTDGCENASHEYSAAKVRELIERREAAGWTFVYMGANQDAYEEGERFGAKAGNIQNFVPDARGNVAAFGSLSRSVLAKQAKMESGLHFSNQQFFEEGKTADRDASERQ